MSPKILAEAEAESISAAVWYEGQREGLGVEFLDEVELAVAAIAATPLRFPELPVGRPGQFRKVSLNRFPYHIVYEIRPEDTWVLAVAHQHRRPNYWTNRSR